jgi:hypothetical protein
MAAISPDRYFSRSSAITLSALSSLDSLDQELA